MEFQQVNPATGVTGTGHPNLSDEELARDLAAAHNAYVGWRRTPLEERASLLRKVARLLRAEQGELAALMALEMGKPLAQGAGEVEKCALVCEFYAEQGPAFLADEAVATEATKSYVHFAPLGVVLAIMPWNFPLWQFFRFGAPALMAGNGIVLKHAPNVPECARAIERIFLAAGAPTGLVSNLFISIQQTGDVIAAKEIAAVTLTGSTRAGRAVASIAGQALKKTVLELGGSDAYVVLEDADIPAAAAACVAGRMGNAGQSCVAAKRWIVVDAAREAFEASVVVRLNTEVLGDPFDERTTVGPMARVDLRDELAGQVERSIEAGARLVLGGRVPEKPGAWYPVTLLADVTPGMAAFDEELFGPVAAIVPAKDEADAIRLANQSVYGLGGAVFTADAARGERIAAEELDAGCAFVNTFARSDPRMPFGGVKESGYGRELGGFGIREFVNAKTVYVA